MSDDFQKRLAKLRGTLDKQGIGTGFVSPDEWLSIGNLGLNYRITGDFYKAIPNRRTVLLWGPKGSGKTYLLALAAKAAQEKGYHVFYIDTETAAEEDYMQKVGLDLSPERFTPMSVPSIEKATEAMSAIYAMTQDGDKVFVAFDSLSMMLSEKEMTEFEKGTMKGDQGQIAKKTKLFMKNVNSKIGKLDMFFVATGHAYVNQDLTNGKGTHIFSGGEGVEFIPSVALFVNRLKLKGEEEVDGVRIKVEVNKTRFTKPFGKIELSVPYNKGIDPLDGFLDIAVGMGLVTKNGSWYNYTDKDGELHKFQSKSLSEHFEKIMENYGKQEITESLTSGEREELEQEEE